MLIRNNKSKHFKIIFSIVGVLLLIVPMLTTNAVKPDNIPPVVTILSPTNGEIVSNIVTISFEAYDQQNDLREYGIRIDGVTISTYTFSYDWDTTIYWARFAHRMSKNTETMFLT